MAPVLVGKQLIAQYMYSNRRSASRNSWTVALYVLIIINPLEKVMARCSHYINHYFVERRIHTHTYVQTKTLDNLPENVQTSCSTLADFEYRSGALF